MFAGSGGLGGTSGGQGPGGEGTDGEPSSLCRFDPSTGKTTNLFVFLRGHGGAGGQHRTDSHGPNATPFSRASGGVGAYPGGGSGGIGGHNKIDEQAYTPDQLNGTLGTNSVFGVVGGEFGEGQTGSATGAGGGGGGGGRRTWCRRERRKTGS
jgi:hypothetical protein